MLLWFDAKTLLLHIGNSARVTGLFGSRHSAAHVVLNRIHSLKHRNVFCLVERYFLLKGANVLNDVLLVRHQLAGSHVRLATIERAEMKGRRLP